MRSILLYLFGLLVSYYITIKPKKYILHPQGLLNSLVVGWFACKIGREPPEALETHGTQYLLITGPTWMIGRLGKSAEYWALQGLLWLVMVA